METLERYSIIENSFLFHLDFLVDKLNYKIEIIKDDYSTPERIQAIEIFLYNEAINRNIKFMYQPFNGGEYTVFSIKNMETHNSIFMDSYLKFNKAGYAPLWPFFRSMEDVPGVHFHERVDNYFAFIVELLSGELKDVIEGKTWILLPMDWEGIY
jgi:hypothetical protein